MRGKRGYITDTIDVGVRDGRSAWQQAREQRRLMSDHDDKRLFVKMAQPSSWRHANTAYRKRGNGARTSGKSGKSGKSHKQFIIQQCSEFLDWSAANQDPEIQT